MGHSIVIVKNKTKVYYNQKKVKDSNWSPNAANTWDKEQSALNVCKDIKKQKEFLSFAKEVRETLMVVKRGESTSKATPTVTQPANAGVVMDEEKLPSTEDIDAFSFDVAPSKQKISFPRN